MSFLLEWHLQKHIEGHSETRTCHYIYDSIVCPFAKVGGKFLHKRAEKCNYVGYCSRPKRQYRHE